ncbi:hypothetical protein FOL47_003681 [Perkinsus chesapeaki]|uniref:Uncharacterized protein n=1 Tax=Perkinsus chesapeaki TaxID=330153 RepID=A0A7J6M713_PERCH|nr:hypothetical protein FOL47_003681 [Perkinsus chesapeaki]
MTEFTPEGADSSLGASTLPGDECMPLEKSLLSNLAAGHARARSPVPPLKIPASVAMQMYGSHRPLSSDRMLASPTNPPFCGNSSAREMYTELFRRADEKIEEQAEMIRKQREELEEANERLRRVTGLSALPLVIASILQSSRTVPRLELAERVAEECDEAHERLHMATDRIRELESLNRRLAEDLASRRKDGTNGPTLDTTSLSSSWCSSIIFERLDATPYAIIIQRFWRGRRDRRASRCCQLWGRLTHRALARSHRRAASNVCPSTQKAQHYSSFTANCALEATSVPADLPLVKGCRPTDGTQRPFRSVHAYRKAFQEPLVPSGIPSTRLPDLHTVETEARNPHTVFATPRTITNRKPDGGWSGISTRPSPGMCVVQSGGDVTERASQDRQHVAVTPRRVYSEWPMTSRTDVSRMAWDRGQLGLLPPQLMDVRRKPRSARAGNAGTIVSMRSLKLER